jgi:hypothetical protein
MVAALTLDAITNQGSGTVTSGGTTAPAQNTVETWTVTAAIAFPAVSVAAGTVFRVIDPAQSGEVMLVTSAPGGISAGQSWQVTRGAENTVPVAHAANFTINEAITAGLLAKMIQGQAGVAGQVAWIIASANGSGTLVAAVAAASGADAASNSFGAGYTGPAAAIQPGSSPAVPEGWHTIILDGGWSTNAGYGTGQYRLLPDGNVQLAGSIVNSSGLSAVTNINSGSPLPAAYRPSIQRDPRGFSGIGNTLGVRVQATGVLQAVATPTFSGQQCTLDGVTYRVP